MGIEIILKIAGVGMLTAIVNVILKKSDKDEIGTFVTIVGIVVVLMMVVDMLTGVMDTVKQLFGLKVITAGCIKSAKSEFSVFVVLATGLVILIMIAKGMSEVLVKFSEIVAKTGIPSALYGAILKIVGVGYLTEFSAGICEDYGAGSVGKKLQLSGKIAIFILAFPVIEAFINVVEKLAI